MFMNECIDSTMGRIHVCFAVLLASDDPRTSWSFHAVPKRLGCLKKSLEDGGGHVRGRG